MKTIWTVLERNRYTFVGGLAALLLVGGCMLFEPQVADPTTGQQVTQEQLNISFEAWKASQQAAFDAGLAQYQLADAELEAQRTQFDHLMNGAQSIVTMIDPTGGAAVVMGSLLAAFGISRDNRRKDSVINDKRVALLEAKAT